MFGIILAFIAGMITMDILYYRKINGSFNNYGSIIISVLKQTSQNIIEIFRKK